MAKTLSHPELGSISFVYATLACEGPDKGYWISIYTPIESTDGEKLRKLLAA